MHGTVCSFTHQYSLSLPTVPSITAVYPSRRHVYKFCPNHKNTQYLSPLAIPFPVIYPHAALQPSLSKGRRPLSTKGRRPMLCSSLLLIQQRLTSGLKLSVFISLVHFTVNGCFGCLRFVCVSGKWALQFCVHLIGDGQSEHLHRCMSFAIATADHKLVKFCPTPDRHVG